MSQKVLVTGGRGMMGTDLCRILRERNYTITVTDRDDLDVRDHGAVLSAVMDLKPDWVAHLAAQTNVDDCEKYPDEAYRTNTIGTQNVALACQATGAIMTYVSTISVFDGQKCSPYTEFDMPNPQSCYSRSKYEGERIVAQLLNRYYIVRAGWMFGGGPEDKKFVAKIIELAQQRESLSVVDDKWGTPTYTHDISDGMERLFRTGLFGTYHLVNSGGYCSRFEFAQAILGYAGVENCELLPVNSAQFPLPAPRPRMEAALNYQLELRGLNWQRPWQEALESYIHTVLTPSYA